MLRLRALFARLQTHPHRGLRNLGRAGSTALEFALVALPLVAIIMGIVEFARYLWMQNTMQYAVDQAARYVMANTTATAAQVKTFAESQALGMTNAGITFAASSASSGGVAYMTITGTYTYQFSLMIWPVGSSTIDVKSRVSLNP